MAEQETLLNFGGIDMEEEAARAIFNPYEPKKETPHRYSILSAPYDLTATYVKGAALGPAAIIEASTHMELYDEELKSEPWRAGFDTLPPLDISELPPEDMVNAVCAASREVISAGRIPVLLGGEHSVTLGLFRALREKHPRLSVIHFDAHADMRASYDDTPFSHACVARRMIEEGAPLAQFGVRSMSREEAIFLEANNAMDILKVKSYQAREVREGLDLEKILASLTDEVFITIDLDVFDPSIMPSTGTPEPGGLLWQEVTSMLSRIISSKKIVGFDIVELSPTKGNVAPDFMAARLAYKIMGYINDSLDVPSKAALEL